jgi:drug/metabolite transporter (DMT)-like permease
MQRDQNVFRYIGFVLAILSWVFWALAGYLVPFTVRASELLAIGILISTSWVVVHLIEILVDRERRKNEAATSLMRQKWVLFNIGYMLCLVGYVGWYRPVIKEGASAMLLVLLAVLLVDMFASRSFRDVTAA